MAKDIEYEALLSKYRIIVARTKDLQEQLTQKQEQLDKIQAENKITDDATRSLCESILAKDRKEMTLGEKSSTWRGSSTRQLLKKAETSFEEYVTKWTNKMNEVTDQLEKAHDINESLIIQIQRDSYNCGDSVPSRDDIMQTTEDDKKNQEVQKSMSENEKKAEKAGIDFVYDDGTIEPTEGDLIEETYNINRDVQLTSNSVKKVDSSHRKQQKDQINVKSAKTHIVNMEDYIEQCKDQYYWDVLEAIGDAGISRFTEIESYVIAKNPKYTKTQIRNTTKRMVSMGLLEEYQISTPTLSKLCVEKLAFPGEEIFKYHFGKVPCECELQKVIRCHDNPVHGYGIVETGKILEEQGIFDTVSCFNKAIKLDENRNFSYVPDIAVTKGNSTYYYEYELGTHTQEDFNDKCNKMLRVNRYLNFVSPNKDIIDDLMIEKINKWIKTKPKEVFKNVRIRITTPNILKSGSVNDYSGWVAVYEFSKGYIRYSEDKMVQIEFKDDKS